MASRRRDQRLDLGRGGGRRGQVELPVHEAARCGDQEQPARAPSGRASWLSLQPSRPSPWPWGRRSAARGRLPGARLGVDEHPEPLVDRASPGRPPPTAAARPLARPRGPPRRSVCRCSGRGAPGSRRAEWPPGSRRGCSARAPRRAPCASGPTDAFVTVKWARETCARRRPSTSLSSARPPPSSTSANAPSRSGLVTRALKSRAAWLPRKKGSALSMRMRAWPPTEQLLGQRQRSGSPGPRPRRCRSRSGRP